MTLPSSRPHPQSVFVTVGTTRFDSLISTILSPPILTYLSNQNYKTITVQHGHSAFPSLSNLNSLIKSLDINLNIQYYNFKPTLKDDIANADLVVSHAGSGSILECLRSNKKLVVVINEELMDNHQFELASELERMGYLVASKCGNLENALQRVTETSLTPFPEQNMSIFPELVDSVFNDITKKTS
ncbi:glycosyl transferase [Paraphysoderma sedebokerense]|nr:glycosyl transferase [Paraphysoderma sedebokerense]